MTSLAHDPRYKKFRQLLAAYRLRQEITQMQLAEKLGRPQSFVSKYENGDRRIDFIELSEIIEALGIKLLDFMHDFHEEASPSSILDEWEITPTQLTEMLAENPSLRGMLLRYVAELKLKALVVSIPNVTYITKLDDHQRKKRGDLFLIYQKRAFHLESKSLQSNSVQWDETHKRWSGKAQVDGSDKRSINLPDGSTLNTTLLLRGEFDILAVNCHAFEGKWHFIFARNADLPTSNYRGYSEEQNKSLIANLVPVSWPPEPPFYVNLRDLLDEMVDSGEGMNPTT